MDDFTLESHLKEFGNDPDFIYEQVLLDLNEQICRRMGECGVTRSQLAERIGVNKAYVSRILNGPANLTLRTIVNVLAALDARPRFVVEGLIESPCYELLSGKVARIDEHRRKGDVGFEQAIDWQALVAEETPLASAPDTQTNLAA